MEFWSDIAVASQCEYKNLVKPVNDQSYYNNNTAYLMRYQWMESNGTRQIKKCKTFNNWIIKMIFYFVTYS